MASSDSSLKDETKKIGQRLTEWFEAERASLRDLGLSIKGDDGREHYTELNAAELTSIIDESDPSMQLRPNLWEVSKERSETNVQDPLGNWPAGLLHVATWTSHEWQTGNIYGSYTEPPYVTISYTWGRLRLPSNHQPAYPALGVAGITWPVPPVDPALFTVVEFTNVLERVAEEADVSFVWVDIACIDQNRGSRQGASEIGRQVKIFGNAKQTFVWLVEDPKRPAPRSANALFRDLAVAEKLAASPVAKETAEIAHSSSRFASDKVEGSIDPRAMDDEIVEEASSCIQSLTRFPWFSSLWTLQEAFIQPQAKFVDKNGSVLCFSHTKLHLSGFLNTCNMFLTRCNEDIESRYKYVSLHDRGDDFQWKAKLLRAIIVNSGLDALAEGDRMALYACARTRQVSESLDRVYGIMQIWDFRLGKTALNADF